MPRTIKEALKKESARKADLIKAKTVRYLGNGIWLYKVNGCNQIGSASAGQADATYPPGMSVNLAAIQGSFQRAIISGPPAGRRGASAFPTASIGGGELDGAAIVQATPSAIPAGSTAEPVELTGAGFREDPTDLIDCVVYNISTGQYDADPYVTVNSVTFVSETRIDITVTTLSITPVGYKPLFRLRRG